ncbi:DNA-binding response regulator [Embleya scabrispora]|uniref:DNA-binding response regulator n=1 Tax=Embleya scabrispora TaxID=159449 RepID=A0A1T3P653_9ACTN|nr:response regulator transcription factor [Embleya scabrispora]OPC84425.1 DNA-binding response regulator [Embleya scabrispora]
MTPIRLVVCDDHAVVRAGLLALFAGEDGIEVIGEAAGGEEAVRLAAALRPDVVLMDLQLVGGIDGVEATGRLLALPEPPHVLVLTMYDTDADVSRAIEAGAAGYLLKAGSPEDLFRAVRDAAAGRTVLAPEVAARLFSRMRRPDGALTVREVEILQLLARGVGNAEIARRLFISQATVKTHLGHIYAKLGVDTRTAAVSVATERRLIRLT